MNEWLRLLLDLPVEASTFAPGIDRLHFVVIGTTMLGATVVFLMAAYFVVRYRRRAEGETTAREAHGGYAELAVVAGLTALFLGFWVVGAVQYDRMFTPPANAMVVYVTAKQWMWEFTHQDGRAEMDTLTVPIGTPVKLMLTSRDVIHSFYVPAFRLKHDAVPGRYYAAWFQATRTGTFDVDCAEYCGLNHSRMLGAVRVLSASDYAAWLGSDTPGPSLDLASRGREVATRRACFACHTLDGQRHIGPSWAGLYGATVHLQGGRTVRADEAYLTRSMMDPSAEVVDGYAPVMPTYRGILDQPEVAALLELMKTAREAPDAPSVVLPAVAPLGSGLPREPLP